MPSSVLYDGLYCLIESSRGWYDEPICKCDRRPERLSSLSKATASSKQQKQTVSPASSNLLGQLITQGCWISGGTLPYPPPDYPGASEMAEAKEFDRATSLGAGVGGGSRMRL